MLTLVLLASTATATIFKPNEHSNEELRAAIVVLREEGVPATEWGSVLGRIRVERRDGRVECGSRMAEGCTQPLTGDNGLKYATLTYNRQYRDRQYLLRHEYQHAVRWVTGRGDSHEERR